MALCLSRRKGESVIIGEGDIAVKVLEITRHGVVLAIAAPDSVAVFRDEIYAEHADWPLSAAVTRLVGESQGRRVSGDEAAPRA